MRETEYSQQTDQAVIRLQMDLFIQHTPDELKVRVKAVHLKKKELQCECGFSTAYRRLLSLHRRIVHMKDGHTECPTCNQVLSSKLKLTYHIK